MTITQLIHDLLETLAVHGDVDVMLETHSDIDLACMTREHAAHVVILGAGA